MADELSGQPMTLRAAGKLFDINREAIRYSEVSREPDRCGEIFGRSSLAGSTVGGINFGGQQR